MLAPGRAGRADANCAGVGFVRLVGFCGSVVEGLGFCESATCGIRGVSVSGIEGGVETLAASAASSMSPSWESMSSEEFVSGSLEPGEDALVSAAGSSECMAMMDAAVSGGNLESIFSGIVSGIVSESADDVKSFD